MTNKTYADEEKILSCPKCLGTKKENNGRPCSFCDDGTETNTSHGLAPFYYESIRGEDNLQTINKQRKITLWVTIYLGLNNAEELRGWWEKYDTSEKNKKHFERVIGEGYIGKELRQNRRLQHKSQTGYVGYLEKAYISNGFTDFDWKRIKQNIRQPDGLSRGEFDAYTEQQIELLHDKSNPKYQTIITVLMSGIRIGGIQERILARDRKKYPDRDHCLKIGDLSDPLEDLTHEQRRDFKLSMPDYDESPIYQMTIYSGDVNAKTGNVEYYTCWTTSEARQRIDDMLWQRQKDGELDEIDLQLKKKPFNIKYFPPDTPLFRTHYNAERSRVWMTAETREVEEKKRLDRLHHPRHLRYADMEIYFTRLRKKYLHPMPIRVKLFNGFRSRVHTVLTHDVIVNGAHLAESEVDFFLGRQLKRMGPFYDRWGKLDSVKKWWEAIPHLTINKKQYLKREIVRKDEQIKREKAEKDQQWAAFSGLTALTKQALQEVKDVKKQINPEMSVEMLKILMGVLTPEQITEAQKRFLARNSSLPSEEEKPVLIDATPSTEEEKHI